jgi:hypothetical protein
LLFSCANFESCGDLVVSRLFTPAFQEAVLHRGRSLFPDLDGPHPERCSSELAHGRPFYRCSCRLPQFERVPASESGNGHGLGWCAHPHDELLLKCDHLVVILSAAVPIGVTAPVEYAESAYPRLRLLLHREIWRANCQRGRARELSTDRWLSRF